MNERIEQFVKDNNHRWELAYEIYTNKLSDCEDIFNRMRELTRGLDSYQSDGMIDMFGIIWEFENIGASKTTTKYIGYRESGTDCDLFIQAILDHPAMYGAFWGIYFAVIKIEIGCDSYRNKTVKLYELRKD